MTQKPPIRFVYFDVGGVLLAFYHIRQDIPKEWGIDPTEFSAIMTQFEQTRSTGKATEIDVEQALIAAFGDRIPRGYWATAQYVERFAPIAPMHELVARLSQVYQVGLLTNVSKLVWDRCHQEFPTLYPNVEFAQVVASYREGVAKPDPEIYRIAIERTGFLPAEICFVDDLPENLRVAEQLGMTTVRSFPGDIAMTVQQLEKLLL